MTSKMYSSASPAHAERLSMGELGEALQQMTNAIRETVSKGGKSSLNDWKKRYQSQGISALKEVPHIKKCHPQTTAPETVQMILDLSTAHPGWGCVRLSDYLKSESHVSVSSPTVQNILIKHGMASRHDRLLKLQSRYLKESVELSEEQVTLIEADNPCFRERDLNITALGELLIQDTLYLGNVPGIGKCYLHAVVDAYSAYAFGFLHTNKKPEPAVAVLHNDALPFLAEKNIAVNAIMSDSDKEFLGKETHPYQTYLLFNDIKHRQLPAKKLLNGCMERFKKVVRDEFKIKGVGSDSFETLQEDMSQWLSFYNNKRPHEGYPNLGKTPSEVFNHSVA